MKATRAHCVGPTVDSARTKSDSRALPSRRHWRPTVPQHGGMPTHNSEAMTLVFCHRRRPSALVRQTGAHSLLAYRSRMHWPPPKRCLAFSTVMPPAQSPYCLFPPFVALTEPAWSGRSFAADEGEALDHQSETLRVQPARSTEAWCQSEQAHGQQVCAAFQKLVVTAGFSMCWLLSRAVPIWS